MADRGLVDGIDRAVFLYLGDLRGLDDGAAAESSVSPASAAYLAPLDPHRRGPDHGGFGVAPGWDWDRGDVGALWQLGSLVAFTSRVDRGWSDVGLCLECISDRIKPDPSRSSS